MKLSFTNQAQGIVKIMRLTEKIRCKSRFNDFQSKDNKRWSDEFYRFNGFACWMTYFEQFNVRLTEQGHLMGKLPILLPRQTLANLILHKAILRQYFTVT